MVCRRALDGLRGVQGVAVGEDLWLITSRRDVLRISPSRVEPETVFSTGQLDITDHCRPLAPRPPDHDSYVRYCVHRLDRRQFSASVHDVQACFVGDWPNGKIHISFTHDKYEGLTLVSTLSLYDEQGIRLDDVTRYAPVKLMEQAGTLAYPDRSLAVDGVLYV